LLRYRLGRVPLVKMHNYGKILKYYVLLKYIIGALI